MLSCFPPGGTDTSSSFLIKEKFDLHLSSIIIICGLLIFVVVVGLDVVEREGWLDVVEMDGLKRQPARTANNVSRMLFGANYDKNEVMR